MRSSNNLSSAFHLSGSNKTLLVSLKPDSDMEDDIDDAEHLIRRTLSTKLPDYLRDKVAAGTAIPKPKFLRQGSRAYDTLNDPIRSSKNYNQADSDIGFYLPMEFIAEATPTPKLGAVVLRAGVLACLTELAKGRWKSVKAMRCCIRVTISDEAHVDVTTYAIPQAKYQEMALALESARNFRKALDSAYADSADAADLITWDEIPAVANLATRDGWIRSDAKAIHQKIQNTQDLKGPVFKRCVRFIKAMRDYADDDEGPMSIAITLIVADHLDIGLCQLGRDDLAVHSMLNVIADQLFSVLPTPGNEDVDILASLSPETRDRLAQRLRANSETMRKALYEMPVEGAHVAMKTLFGERFPDAESSVEQRSASSVVSSVTILTSSSVKAVAPKGNARTS